MNILKNGEIGGTCLMGYLEATYLDLVEIFGEPHMFNGDKTTVEWAFKFEGTDEVFTIYDWKTSMTPLHTYNWHIGGNSTEVLDRLRDFLQIKGKSNKVSESWIPSGGNVIRWA